MERQPGVDMAVWGPLLAYRARGDERTVVAGKLADCGISPQQLAEVLSDGGDELYARAKSRDQEWADHFGGPLAAALLAAEVSALAAHLNSRAAAIRVQAIDDMLDSVSAVAVAAHLGVSRQKIYELTRARPAARFIDRVPWRKP
ncbi:MAG: hypothetical protein KF801_09695 [Cryobacterium sp.]|nr:hypothetical protein [Cryobacterium sp.]